MPNSAEEGAAVPGPAEQEPQGGGDQGAPVGPAGSKSRCQGTRPEVQAFVAQLAEEERMLVILQRELYEGSWDAMLTDLNNRLEGKPFIFKLANRIRDDIARIKRLQAFEEEYEVQLADFVEPPSA